MKLIQTTIVASSLFALAASLAVGPMGFAQAQIKGVAVAADPVPELQRRVAALEARVKQLEAVTSDIKKSMNKADTADDSSDSGKKSGPESGSGKGKGAQAAGDEDSGPLHDMPARPGVTTVLKAPVKIVDQAGRTLLLVQDPTVGGALGGGDRGLYIFNPQGVSTVALTAPEDGGRLKLRKANNDFLDMNAYGSHLSINVGVGGTRVATMSAGAGAPKRGIISVWAEGSALPAAVMTHDGNSGFISVVNKDGKFVARLSESSHPGGGNVTTTDPSGTGIFSAGYDGDEGEACVDRKQHLHCLGIDLPLSMGK